MVIATENREIDTNIDQSQVFKIKTTAQAFKILSSNLYSNKIRAIVRELSCNAVDAHKAAGNPNPFEVHLPNIFEPYFSVKDFGIGLSDNDVFNLYNSYFESTKSQSNDFIGALGLGSKSPFSYVDSFTVESVFNGEKRIYSTYLNAGGIPTTSFMSASECSDHNGLEVKIPVKESDYDRFQREAEVVFYAFNLKPVITNNLRYTDLQEKEKEDKRIVQLGNGWKIVKSFPGSVPDEPYARQGGIMYPLKKDILLENVADEISKKASFVLENRIMIDFPLGQLDVAASREEISYDETTKKNIIKKLNEVYDEVLAGIDKEMNTKSLYDAICYINETTGNFRGRGYLQFLHVASGRTIKGDERLTYQAFFTYYYLTKRYGYGSLYDYRVSTRKNEKNKYSENTWTFSIQPSFNGCHFIEIDEVLPEYKLKNKLRQYAGINNLGDGIIVIPFLPEIKADLLEAFGNPSYIKISDIVMPTVSADKVKMERSTERNFSEKNMLGTDTFLDFYTISESNDDIKYYIPTYINEYIIAVDGEETPISYDRAQKYISFLKEIGFITNDTSYYCVKKKELKYKRFETDPNFKPLAPAADAYLLNYITKNERKIIRILKKSKEIENIKTIELARYGIDGKDKKIIENFFNKLEDNAFKKAYLRVRNKNLQNAVEKYSYILNCGFLSKAVKAKIEAISNSVVCDVDINDVRFLNMFSYCSWRDDTAQNLESLAGLVNMKYRESNKIGTI